jgi:hypothetical protein
MYTWGLAKIKINNNFIFLNTVLDVQKKLNTKCFRRTLKQMTALNNNN